MASKKKTGSVRVKAKVNANKASGGAKKRSASAAKARTSNTARTASKASRGVKRSPASVRSAVRRATAEAREVLGDPAIASRFSREAERLARENRPQFIDVLEDLSTLIRMIRAYSSGRYRDVPWSKILAATAAIVYVVNPMDLIPDMTPVVGYVDDAAVVAFVVQSLLVELEAFREWEKEGSPRQGPRKPR